ncbi:hypothetical protein JCM11491_006197 [Sporobolomyces phaffii]
MVRLYVPLPVSTTASALCDYLLTELGLALAPAAVDLYTARVPSFALFNLDLDDALNEFDRRVAAAARPFRDRYGRPWELRVRRARARARPSRHDDDDDYDGSWISLRLEGLGTDTSRAAVETLLGRHLQFWRSLTIRFAEDRRNRREGGIVVEFQVRGERTVRTLERAMDASCVVFSPRPSSGSQVSPIFSSPAPTRRASPHLPEPLGRARFPDERLDDRPRSVPSFYPRSEHGSFYGPSRLVATTRSSEVDRLDSREEEERTTSAAARTSGPSSRRRRSPRPPLDRMARLEDAQVIVDRLVDLISTASRDGEQVQLCIDRLSRREIELRHSTVRLSPLEALFVRYPFMHETDLGTLDALLAKGADLGNADDSILADLVDKAERGHDGDDTARRFGEMLVDKFATSHSSPDEGRAVHEVAVDTVEPRAWSDTSTLTPLSSSRSPPSQAVLIPSPRIENGVLLSSSNGQDRVSPLSPPPPELVSTQEARNDAADADAAVAPSVSVTPPEPQLSVPTLPPPASSWTPRPPSHPTVTAPPAAVAPVHRAPTPVPTPTFRLFTRLPPSTSPAALTSYFSEILGLSISNVVIRAASNKRYASSAAFAHFDLDARQWDLREVERRLRANDDGRVPARYRFGTAIGWKVEVARAHSRYTMGEAESSHRRGEGTPVAGGRESEPRFAPSSSFTPSTSSSRGPRIAPRPRAPGGISALPERTHRVGRDEVVEGWIRVKIRGFALGTTVGEVSQLLARYLEHWRNYDIDLVLDGDQREGGGRGGLAARIEVRGGRIYRFLKNALEDSGYGGQPLQVDAEDDWLLLTKARQREDAKVVPDERQDDASKTQRRGRVEESDEEKPNVSRAETPEASSLGPLSTFAFSFPLTLPLSFPLAFAGPSSHSWFFSSLY